MTDRHQTNGAFRNVLSVVGAFITTVAAVVFLIVFLADLFGLHTNPYLGIVFFLILPAFFVLGLLLMPIGVVIERRRRRRGRPASVWPRIDFNDPGHRQRTMAILALTAANVVIVSLASYKGLEYMDTPAFCGQVCHQVMKPEFVSHQSAPHASVACVECHVAPGAAGLVEAKLSGVRRVFAVMRESYQRPIPPPAAEMIPARDTCERCHWPEKFHGAVVKRVAEFGTDEANTESVTTLRLKVGGGSERLGVATGIHWHMNIANEIEYVATDTTLQTISYVKLRDRSGAVREYFTPGTTPEQLAGGIRRQMQCLDCHNRPAHPIASTPGRAVDQSLALGQLPATLPFIKREAVRVLETSYTDETEALTRIGQELTGFYGTAHKAIASARADDIRRAVNAVQSIYRNNVFPQMNVKFGTYVNNIGHIDSPGCFRCHDEEKATMDGRTIGQDCALCHDIE